MTSVVTIAVGMAFLAVSLAVRHADAPALVAWIASWVGCALVIVGSGQMFFLER